MKLFNGKTFIISSIKQEEIEEVLNIAREHNLTIIFEDMFLEKRDLIRVCIDDESLGGHLMAMICSYEMNVVKNIYYGVFENVDELKLYIEKADRRKEHYVLKESDSETYENYIATLTPAELKEEYLLVKNLLGDTCSFYKKTKNYIENKLIKPICKDIIDKKASFELIEHYLKRINEQRNELFNFFNDEIYLIDSHQINSEKIPDFKMLRYLKEHYEDFHGNDDSDFNKLKYIYEIINITFNLFNFKLRCENIVSYDNKAYGCLRKLGYTDILPDYLVGVRKQKTWDYRTVFKRLFHSLALYDCPPLLNNKSIYVGPVKNKEEVEVLAKRLIKVGYKDKDDLANCTKQEHKPISIEINGIEKVFKRGPNNFIMACVCSSRKRATPLIKQLLSCFDQIITNYDFIFYNRFLSSITSQNKRPIGIFSLRKSRKKKTNISITQPMEITSRKR